MRAGGASIFDCRTLTDPAIQRAEDAQRGQCREVVDEDHALASPLWTPVGADAVRRFTDKNWQESRSFVGAHETISIRNACFAESLGQPLRVHSIAEREPTDMIG